MKLKFILLALLFQQIVFAEISTSQATLIAPHSTISYEVVDLKRVSIGNLTLGNIPLGRWRHLSNAEINYLKSL